MGIVGATETVYYIRCDGCYRRARYAFHRIVSIGYAKHQGYTHHTLITGNGTESVWLCKGCSKNDDVRKRLLESAPKPATSTRR